MDVLYIQPRSKGIIISMITISKLSVKSYDSYIPTGNSDPLKVKMIDKLALQAVEHIQ